MEQIKNNLIGYLSSRNHYQISIIVEKHPDLAKAAQNYAETKYFFVSVGEKSKEEKILSEIKNLLQENQMIA